MPTDKRQAGVEVEVTDEMIEVGVAELFSWSQSDNMAELIVEAIFTRMWAAMEGTAPAHSYGSKIPPCNT